MSILSQIPPEAIAGEIGLMFRLMQWMGIAAFKEALDNGSSPAEAFEIAGDAAELIWVMMPADIGDMTADMMCDATPRNGRHGCTNDGGYAA